MEEFEIFCDSIIEKQKKTLEEEFKNIHRFDKDEKVLFLAKHRYKWAIEFTSKTLPKVFPDVSKSDVVLKCQDGEIGVKFEEFKKYVPAVCRTRIHPYSCSVKELKQVCIMGMTGMVETQEELEETSNLNNDWTWLNHDLRDVCSPLFSDIESRKLFSNLEKCIRKIELIYTFHIGNKSLRHSIYRWTNCLSWELLENGNEFIELCYSTNIKLHRIYNSVNILMRSVSKSSIVGNKLVKTNFQHFGLSFLIRLPKKFWTNIFQTPEFQQSKYLIDAFVTRILDDDRYLYGGPLMWVGMITHLIEDTDYVKSSPELMSPLYKLVLRCKYSEEQKESLIHIYNRKFVHANYIGHCLTSKVLNRYADSVAHLMDPEPILRKMIIESSLSKDKNLVQDTPLSKRMKSKSPSVIKQAFEQNPNKSIEDVYNVL